jgi:hypothetical protein
MARQGDFTPNQIHNIEKAGRFLLLLFESCPALGSRANWAAITGKAAELTESGRAVKKHFGHDDPFLEKRRAHGWTEKFLSNLWNRYILIHTSLVPDREMNENIGPDAALRLHLALTLWHETAHWEGAQDNWIEVEEFTLLGELQECRFILDHPCSAELIAEIKRQMGMARDDDGWWHGL